MFIFLAIWKELKEVVFQGFLRFGEEKIGLNFFGNNKGYQGTCNHLWMQVIILDIYETNREFEIYIIQILLSKYA